MVTNSLKTALQSLIITAVISSGSLQDNLEMEELSLSETSETQEESFWNCSLKVQERLLILDLLMVEQSYVHPLENFFALRH